MDGSVVFARWHQCTERQKLLPWQRPLVAGYQQYLHFVGLPLNPLHNQLPSHYWWRAGSSSNTMWPWPRPTSVPSGILIHPAIWWQKTWAEKRGLLCSFLGELGPHLTQCHLGQGLPPYQVASWYIQPFGHNRHGLKIGRGQYPFWGRRSWVSI